MARTARIGAAVALLAGLAGCGPAKTVAAPHAAGPRAAAPAARPAAPPGVTPMPALGLRLHPLPASRIPVWTLVTGTGRPVPIRLNQWPNVVVVAPTLYMGPLWEELRSARPQIRQPVVVIAVDWPPGTRLAVARRTMDHVLGPGHLGWPVYYLWPPGGRFVPAPTTLLTRGGHTAWLAGVLPAAQDWAALFNRPQLPSERG